MRQTGMAGLNHFIDSNLLIDYALLISSLSVTSHLFPLVFTFM